MRKSLFLTVICILLVSAVLWAGGQQPGAAGAPASGADLLLWTGSSASLMPVVQDLIDTFQKNNSNIKITYETMPQGEMITRMMPALAAKSGPDIVGGNQQVYTPLVENGLVQPIPTSIVSDAYMKENYIPGADVGISFGKRYAVPTGVMGPVLYVNTELLAKAGITKMGDTWDEVFQNASKLAIWNGSDLAQAGLSLITGPADAYTLMCLVYQQGGKFITDNGKKCKFDTPEMLNAIRLARSLYDKKLNMRGFLNNQESFQNGKSAAAVMWTWFGNTLLLNNPNLPWAAQPMPRFKKEGPYGRSNSLSFHLLITTQVTGAKTEAAWKFWQFASLDNVGRLAQAEGTVPTRKSNINDQWLNNRKDLTVLKTQIMDPKGGYTFPVSVPQPWLDGLAAICDTTIFTDKVLNEDQIRAILRQHENDMNLHLSQHNYPFSPDA